MNAALEAVQAYWIAGGPLLGFLAAIAFCIWAYYFRSHALLRHLRQAALHALPSEAETEQWRSLARRDFGLLAAFTAAAPLVGLLGTVLGMVGTFDAVGDLFGDPSRRIAGGIRQALVTTQFGLLIAIPGVFGLARLQRLARDLETLIIRLRHEGRRS